MLHTSKPLRLVNLEILGLPDDVDIDMVMKDDVLKMKLWMLFFVESSGRAVLP